MRWTTVGEGSEGLFDADALAERHVGRGEFRGMEFLHVNAKTIISAVPASSHMPFRYTINAYRGCSHACSYCMVGDTLVLMADGTSRALADIRPGDQIYGTIRRGGHRRYQRTVVLDHWTTVKPAWRVSLADGTELVASGDHRFRTRRGWKHVAGADQGAAWRPHLELNDRLVGSGVGPAFTSDARLEVVAIKSLGFEMPMYDITTGTGDFIANGVVSHNCFARPTHDYLGLGIGEDFERKIVVKVNAVERLRAELAAKRWAGHHIAMGTNTDPYQRCEGKYHLTQGILGVLSEAANPFSILTKSTLILRDLDLLVEAAGRTDVRVNLSVGTLDDAVWRLTEPGTPRPIARIEAVRRLNQAGVPCGVLVAPVLPGLSDRDEQLEAVIDAAVAAGAVSISAVSLHLRPGVRDHYLSQLAVTQPALAAATDERYRSAAGTERAYLPKADQAELSGRVRGMVAEARRRHGWSGRYGGDDFADRVRVHMGGDTDRPPPKERPPPKDHPPPAAAPLPPPETADVEQLTLDC